jgi:FKBP-type peptidyl-prolyl cis-trans isomerase SlyD
MKMKDGDFVYIDYVGKVKDSGEIFDITNEQTARKEDVWKEAFKYGPVPVVVGADFVLPGLNDALKEMKIGENKKVEIKPDRAFGERNPEYVKLIPEARFKEQNVDMEVGQFVTINRLRGKVLSMDGGRVRVDFNHPLAGKTLAYDLTVVGKIEDAAEKVQALVYYFVGVDKEGVDVVVKGKEIEVEFKNKIDVHKEAKETIATNALKYVEGIEKVRFVDVFEKSDKEKK